jgi:hypothetical protein
LKLCQDAAVCAAIQPLHKIEVKSGADEWLLDEPGRIGDGGNSGFQAINLALQFGASKIILVGYDMRLDRGVHWHGRHGSGLNNPRDVNVMRWRRAIDAAAPTAARLGVRIINASMESALCAYPKMSIEQALAC